jgi:hypothetical protein
MFRYRGIINKNRQTENSSTTCMENYILVYKKQTYLSVRLRKYLSTILKYKWELGESRT